jgi:hypothetical protein
MGTPLVGLLALLLALGTTPATPTPAAVDESELTALVSRAVEATTTSPTLHFSVRNEAGETTIFPGVRLVGIEGDVHRPDRFRATLLAEALFADVEIGLVGIGERFWWANPLLGGDDYQEEAIDPEILALARPDTIVELIPPLVDDLAVVGRESLDGVPTTVLTGTLDLPRLAEVAPDLPNSAVNIDRSLPIRVWIDDDDLIRRIQIDGPFFAYDDDEVVRVIDLSAFGEPVEIEPPG